MLKKIYSFYFIIIILILLSDCHHTDIRTPIAYLNISPLNGNTVTEFQFDGSETIIEGDDIELFFRWDLENDGIWDTQFSKGNTITHRYLTKGIYYPVMEVRNGTGLSDTIQNEITVVQGYSAPNPSFLITPNTGNLHTDFLFDASSTFDYEDSLGSIKFRWDWQGDGNYDTEFDSLPYVRHKFNYEGIYNIYLEAKDPSDLTKSVTKELLVDLHNPMITGDFTISPDSGTTYDIFTFTAVNCYNIETNNRNFRYRWTLIDDNDSVIFISGYRFDSIFTYKFSFSEIGINKMILDIEGEDYLFNSKTKLFKVYYNNLPPTADFIIAPKRGNTSTNFYFRTWYRSTDPEEESWKLKVRWDFENDGNWDTMFSPFFREMYHKYEKAGEYQVKVEIMDSGGLTDTKVSNIYVSNGTNQTGFVEHQIPPYDERQWNYYGTVKIGNQWWTSENIQLPYFERWISMWERSFGFCYDNNQVNCQNYGVMYPLENLIFLIDSMESTKWHYLFDRYEMPPCPKGWHLPYNYEWDDLINYVGESVAGEELSVGGSTDFNALPGGEWSYQQASDGLFLGLEEYTGFWSRYKIAMKDTVNPNKSNGIVWTISNTIKTERHVRGWRSGYYLRCLKDE